VNPFRAINLQRVGPAVEGHSLDKAEYPEEMVCMPVGDKYGVDGKPAPGPHHLLLRPLTAVKEERVRSAPDHDAGGIALGGRECTGGPEEIDLQGFTAHGKSVLWFFATRSYVI
jgi:hypothetical protein